MNDVIGGVGINLLSEFVIVVFGVLVANFVKSRWNNWRYGNWTVTVIDDDGAEHVREVSAKKAEQILDMPEEKSVYLKGIAGAYEWINCDLITEGVQIGMLTEDTANKRFVIDMRKNPPARQRQDGGAST